MADSQLVLPKLAGACVSDFLGRSPCVVLFSADHLGLIPLYPPPELGNDGTRGPTAKRSIETSIYLAAARVRALSAGP